MTAFIAKKILSRLLFPLPFCIGLLIVGLFLLWFTKKQKIGKVVVTLGTVLLLLLSYDAFSENLLRGLERAYPPLSLVGSSELQTRSPEAPVKWVVVLGGGHTADPSIPLSSQLEHSTLARLVEGIVLYRQNQGSKLIVSGGRLDRSIADSELMADLAEAIGVPRADIIQEDRSWDTEDEARLIKPMVQDDALILVTSASHMPRSVQLFEHYGMHPIPAPTDYLSRNKDTLIPDSLLPEPRALLKATRVVYEYLGMAWLKLKGMI